MPPEQKQITEQRIKEIIREEIYNSFYKGNNFVFEKNLRILDGRNIQVGRTTGTTIGLSASEKVSLHGATPIIQSSKINDPSGGATQDAEARTAINAIIDCLEAKGLSASS